MKKLLLTIIYLLPINVLIYAQDTTFYLRGQYHYKTFTLPYRVLVPQHIKSGKKYPLVVFLHGSGERGNDNSKQLKHGAWVFTEKQNLDKYPCYVIAPQCPEKKRWVESDWGAHKGVMSDTPSITMDALIQLVDSFIAMQTIDTTRIYITGLSMGGFGTWELACRLHTHIAAIVPICGGGDENKAYLLKTIPVWAFHGVKDLTVQPARAINMVDAVNKAGGYAKLTLYPDAEHDAWTATYNNPKVLKWLFAQKKK